MTNVPVWLSNHDLACRVGFQSRCFKSGYLELFPLRNQFGNFDAPHVETIDYFSSDQLPGLQARMLDEPDRQLRKWLRSQVFPLWSPIATAALALTNKWSSRPHSFQESAVECSGIGHGTSSISWRTWRTISRSRWSSAKRNFYCCNCTVVKDRSNGSSRISTFGCVLQVAWTSGKGWPGNNLDAIKSQRAGNTELPDVGVSKYWSKILKCWSKMLKYWSKILK